MKDTSIAVRRGQRFRVKTRKPGKKAQHVQIVGIKNGASQPRVTYRLVTRSGRPKPPKESWSRHALRSNAKHPPVARAWLQWRDGAWRPPESWEEI